MKDMDLMTQDILPHIWAGFFLHSPCCILSLRAISWRLVKLWNRRCCPLLQIFVVTTVLFQLSGHRYNSVNQYLAFQWYMSLKEILIKMLLKGSRLGESVVALNWKTLLKIRSITQLSLAPSSTFKLYCKETVDSWKYFRNLNCFLTKIERYMYVFRQKGRLI